MSSCPDYDLIPNIEKLHKTMLCSIQMLCSVCAILANTLQNIFYFYVNNFYGIQHRRQVSAWQTSVGYEWSLGLNCNLIPSFLSGSDEDNRPGW